MGLNNTVSDTVAAWRSDLQARRQASGVKFENVLSNIEAYAAKGSMLDVEQSGKSQSSISTLPLKVLDQANPIKEAMASIVSSGTGNHSASSNHSPIAVDKTDTKSLVG